MRPSHVEAAFRAAVKEPRKTPSMFLEGQPGIGKSAVPKGVARELNETEGPFGWLDTRASQHDPTDFRGIPAVIKDADGTDRAVWLAPEDIPFENNKLLLKRGIWMLDEVTSSPPLVQAVLYQAVLDHRIGEHGLMPDWYIIAAGNRIQDRAVTYPMSSALANRFTHIQFEPNLDDWLAWAKRNQINPNIIMFIRFKPGMLFSFNPGSSEKAFPSPRTWEFASRHLEIMPRNLLSEILEGTIGKGARSEFMSFLKLQTELPDIETIFKGSNFVPERIDLKYALVGALAQRAKGSKEFERMVQYSGKLDTEFAVLLLTTLAQKDQQAMLAAPSFERWAVKHRDIIAKVK